MQMIDVLTQSPFLLEFFFTKVATIEDLWLAMPGQTRGAVIPDATSLTNELLGGGRDSRLGPTQS